MMVVQMEEILRLVYLDIDCYDGLVDIAVK